MDSAGPSRRPLSPVAEQRPAKRPRKTPIIFPSDLVLHMAEWWELEPALYNKRCDDYRKPDKKNEIMRLKVADLKSNSEWSDLEVIKTLDLDGLHRWMNSKKDTVTRRPLTRSGQAREPTSQESEVKRIFGFLAQNVAAGNVGVDNLGSYDQSQSSQGEDSQEDTSRQPSPTGSEQGEPSGVGTATSQGAQQRTSPGIIHRRQRMRDSQATTALENKLSELISVCKTSMGTNDNTLSDRQRQARDYGNLISRKLEAFPVNVQDTLYINILSLINSHQPAVTTASAPAMVQQDYQAPTITTTVTTTVTTATSQQRGYSQQQPAVTTSANASQQHGFQFIQQQPSPTASTSQQDDNADDQQHLRWSSSSLGPVLDAFRMLEERNECPDDGDNI